MVKHLPSISSLRAFEATARHLSFTRAAIELNLTQTAISHRIKDLETLLSMQLFVRLQTGIEITDSGRQYLDAIRPALSQIAAATYSTLSVHDNHLRVLCLSAFAIERLFPLLPDFWKRHPDIELHIAPSIAGERSLHRDFDVAVLYGPDDWQGLDAHRVASEEVFPVCAPSLLGPEAPTLTLSDLARYPIIRTVSPIVMDEWPLWLQGTGASSADIAQELHCESLYFAMRATLAGLGLGLGRTSLVAKALASGELIEPFRRRISIDSSYFIVSRPAKSRLSKVKAFRSWLLHHFNDTRA